MSSTYIILLCKNIQTLFQIDTKFSKDPNYVYYDFNKPEDIPSNLINYFDFVLIDPPFITEEVWSKYADAAKKIITKDESGLITGKFLGSSIVENKEMLERLLDLQPKNFKPSIPNLIY